MAWSRTLFRPKKRGDRLRYRSERSAMTCHHSRIAIAVVSIFGATALAFNRMLGGCAQRDLKQKEPCNDR